MMKAEALLPLDLELNVLNQGIRKEHIWLTKNQFEVLEIVALASNQTLSEYIWETILSILECELDDTLSLELKKKLGNKEVLQS
jgi:hypothetical protein